MERAVARFGHDHHGIARFDMLHALTVTDRMIWTRIHAARWQLVHRRVVYMGSGPLTREGQWLAAVWAAGDRALLTGLAGAELWDMIRYRSPRIDVVTTGDPRELEGFHLHRTRYVGRSDIALRKRIPVGSPSRIIVDCAELVDPYEIIGLIDQAARKQRLRLKQVHALKRRLRNRRHCIAALEFAIAQYKAGSTGILSRSELVLVKAIRAAGLPLPLVNVVVELSNGHHKLDLWWPELGVTVEVDDPGHSIISMKRKDILRNEGILADGVSALRVTNDDVDERIGGVIVLVRRLLSGGYPAGTHKA
jgi:very-short-patch-repair endonuclease